MCDYKILDNQRCLKNHVTFNVMAIRIVIIKPGIRFLII